MVTDLKSEAYNYIRKEIIEGHWPEDRVLSTVRLSKACGTSLGPVREAIVQLEAEGLVEKVENRGIRPRRLTFHEFQQMFEVRLYLESGAAELAAERITPRQFQRMEEIFKEHRHVLRRLRDQVRTGKLSEEDCYGSDLSQQAAELNIQFHLSLIEASENQQMMKLVGDLHILSNLLQGWLLPTGETYLGRTSRDILHHHRILRGLKHKNPHEASRAMRNHIRDAMSFHLKIYDRYLKLRGMGKEGRGVWPATYFQRVGWMESGVSKEQKDTVD